MRRTWTGRSRTRRSKKPFGLFVALAMAGCGFASAPLKDTPKIVATPQPGQLNVMTQPSSPIGDVQPGLCLGGQRQRHTAFDRAEPDFRAR
jgi:hypothetical protein